MTDKVTMTALDTLHISNVRADNLVEGDVFTVSEADAKRLEDAGVAKRGGKESDAVNVRNAAVDTGRDELDRERGELKAIGVAPENKAHKAAPANRSERPKRRK